MICVNDLLQFISSPYIDTIMYTDDTSFIFDKCENIWEVVDDIVYELLVIVNVIFSTY